MRALACLMIAMVSGTISAVEMVPDTVHAQVIGPEAEMDRLQAKAEEAIANGDADSAAMNMGKAALMAQQLAKRNPDTPAVQWYRGLESLFRAQEEAYRAEALFVRAGSQLPASTGVCGSLALARQHIAKAVTLLTDATPADTRQQPAGTHASAMSWVSTIESLSDDYQCKRLQVVP